MAFPMALLTRFRAVCQLPTSGALHQVREFKTTLRAGLVLNLRIPPPAARSMAWRAWIVGIWPGELHGNRGRTYCEFSEHKLCLPDSDGAIQSTHEVLPEC